MASIASVSYVTAPTLFPLTVLEQVNLSIKYGNSCESAFAYATYGLILCGKVGDLDSGYQFGQLALNVLEQFNAKHLKARTLFVVNVFIRHWKESARKTLKPLLEGYKSGLETGDLEYAAFCVQFYCSHSYFTGKELALFEQEIALYADVIDKLKRETILCLTKIYQQAVSNLMDRGEYRCRLIGEYYDEEKMLSLHLKANYKTAICSLYFHKLILSYLFGDFKQAIENAAFTEKYIDALIGTINVPYFYFFDCLAHLAIYCEASKSEQKRIFKKVRANQKKMKKWAAHAPTNYLHKFYLVEAERHRVLGKDSEAADYYDRAIALAKEHEYINEEALANELAAKFYLAKGKDAIASAYMLNAHYCYLQWGATAKVKDLEEKYPQIFSRVNQSSAQGRTQITTFTSDRGLGAELDLATVMKASQAISGEIMLDKLLAELMKILIENAGAQKGFLILKTNGKLLIEAEGVVDSESVAGAIHRVTVLQSISIESKDGLTPPLPVAIINYVVRTKENVVLNHATREGKFTNDPYILQHKPKSILCTPLINQGKLIGILYLENNLTGGAFTPERLEVLQLLSSQAAISIQNAKLYSEVRESENRLAQILEAMPVGVVVIDANGKPYYSNHTAEQLLGKGVVRSAQLNQLSNVYQLYSQGTNQPYPKEKMTIVRALKGEKAIIDDMEIHQGDKIIPVESRGTPVFDEKGNIAYAIAAFQDITERKRAEAERIKFTNKLFQLNKAYERFVPRQFLQFLEKKSIVDVQLGDHVQQEMSVLFADIRDFTTLSESMTPEENFKFINSYLSRMSPVISQNHGFIDKYIGDAIMALFSGSADNAVKASIAMLHSLAEYNQHRQKQGYATIQIGIGINTGLLMLGTVGEQNRMDGTVISDAVNLASRIEEVTKSYGVSLLISHQTFSRLQDASQYDIRIVDRIKVKGKSEFVTVYEVFDADLPEIREGKLVTKTLFEEAQKLYTMGNFRAAAQCFQNCLSQNPRDKVVQIYLERCQLKEKG
jgi:PAS domain S-box-containing protein